MKTVTTTLCSLLLFGVMAAGFAQAKTYKYKCPKCSRISEYASPQAGPKCPSGDGWIMTPVK